MRYTVSVECDVEAVQSFYQSVGLQIEPSAGDTLLVARQVTEARIVGATWLDRSSNTCVLRKVHVSPEHHCQGIGRALVAAAIREAAGEECWCVPWSHLTSFYESAGFTVARVDLAPRHLRRRVEDYRRQSLDVTLMVRRPT